jgi:hypothetical protein
MSRVFSSNFAAILDNPVMSPFLAVELLFDSGAVRLWTGLKDLSVGGYTYTGAGSLLGVSAVEETSEVAAKGANLTLSGIPSEIISLALNEDYQGRTAKVYFGLMNVTSGLPEMNQIFSGLMDQMNIEDTGQTLTVEVTVENRLIDLERARIRRYTSEDQKRLYPSDLGFDFVNDLQDKEIVWGRS